MTLKQGKWAIGSAVVLAIITAFPQFALCYERGLAWNGGYAYFDPDELAYSAYVNTLIDGRPRRNDPFSATSGGPFETLFSIQFLPAYSIAILARIVGLSSSAAFIWLVPIVTVASALIFFLLLFEFTHNEVFSAAAAVGILCFGIFAAQTPWEFPAVPNAFPFLRRYLPAVPFPFFFIMALSVWRALSKNSLRWASIAGLILVFLIYSYFFIWTAAAIWLMTLMILWIVARFGEYRVIGRVFGVIALLGGAALVPYFWLLAQRTPATDQAQVLEFTHRVDLLRGPEVYSAAILAALAVFGKRVINFREPKVLFLLSFLCASFILFNQQVLTGHSLQPFHYEWYIANYWVLAGLFLSIGLIHHLLSKRISVYLVIGALTVGVILAARFAAQTLDTNVQLDKGRAIALRLRGGEGVVFAAPPLTHTIATTAIIPVLWSEYLYAFSPENPVQRKLRFYKYLYYSAATEQSLRLSLEQEAAVRGEIFGTGRANDVLTSNPRIVSVQEIEGAVAEYRNFCSAFDRREAVNPILAYAVLAPGEDSSNLDRWYERDAGEKIEEFTLYRLRLR